MKTETIEGTVKTAFGRKVGPFPFKGDVQLFESAEELRASGKWPNEADIVGYVNTDVRARRRAELISDVLEKNKIQKPDENDPQYRLETMVKMLVASGKYNEQSALDFAEQALGVKRETVEA